MHVVPQSDIYYTGVDALRSEIRSASLLYRCDFPVVLECARFMQFDATFVEMLMAVAKELANDDVLFILQHMRLEHQQQLPVASNVRFANEDQDSLPLEIKL